MASCFFTDLSNTITDFIKNNSLSLSEDLLSVTHLIFVPLIFHLLLSYIPVQLTYIFASSSSLHIQTNPTHSHSCLHFHYFLISIIATIFLYHTSF